MSELRELGLFAGIGGFSSGLQQTGGFHPVGFVEINPFCQEVLLKHWPDVPCYPDVTTREFVEGEADVITAGFPCQDISLAGDGAGLAGSRSGLWREVVRAIRLVRPARALLENVAALLGRGMGRVLGDLAEVGHDAEWDSLPTALDLGHRRDRTLIVAHAVREGLPERSGPVQNRANASTVFTRQRFASLLKSVDPRQKWSDRPLLGRGIHGVPGRVGRVTAAGNSIRPKIPQIIGEAILASEASR